MRFPFLITRALLCAALFALCAASFAHAKGPRRIVSVDPGWAYYIPATPTIAFSSRPSAAEGPRLVPETITVYGDDFTTPNYTLLAVSLDGIICRNPTPVNSTAPAATANPANDVITASAGGATASTPRSGVARAAPVAAVTGIRCTLDASTAPAEVLADLAATGLVSVEVSTVWQTPAGGNKTVTLPRGMVLYQPAIRAVVPPAFEATGESEVRVTWQGLHRDHWARLAVTLAGVATTTLRVTGHYAVVKASVVPLDEDQERVNGDIVVSLLPPSHSVNAAHDDCSGQSDEDTAAAAAAAADASDAALMRALRAATASLTKAYSQSSANASARATGLTGDPILAVLPAAVNVTNRARLNNPVVTRVSPSWAFTTAAELVTETVTDPKTGKLSTVTVKRAIDPRARGATIKLTLTGSALGNVEQAGVNGLTCQNVFIEDDSTLTCDLPACLVVNGAAGNGDGSAGDLAAAESNASCVGPGWIGLYNDHTQIGYAGFEFVKPPLFESLYPGTDIPYSSDAFLTLLLSQFNPHVPFLLTVVDTTISDESMWGRSSEPCYLRLILPRCADCTETRRGSISLQDSDAVLPTYTFAVEVSRVPPPPPNVFSALPSSIVLGDDAHALTFTGDSLLAVSRVAISVDVPDTVTANNNNNNDAAADAAVYAADGTLLAGPVVTSRVLRSDGSGEYALSRTRQVEFVLAADIEASDTKLSGSFPYCGVSETACLPGEYPVELYDADGALIVRSQTHIVLAYSAEPGLQLQLVFAQVADDYDNVDAFLAKLLAVLTNIYPGTTKPVNSSDDGANHNNEARSVSVSTGVRSRLASRLFSTPVSTVYSAVTSEVTVGEGLDARLVLKRSSKWKSALRSSVNNTRVIVQFLPGFNLDTSPSPTAGVAAVQNAIDTPGSALRLALPKLSVSRTQAQTAVTVARCGLDSFKSDCALTAAQEDEVDEACGLDCTPGDDDSGGGGGGIDPTRIIVMVTVVSLVAAVAIIVMMLRARNRRSKRARAGQAPSGGIIGSSGGGGSGSVTGDAYGGVTTGGLLDEDEVDREFKALDCANVSVGRSFGEADCRHPSYDSTGIN